MLRAQALRAPCGGCCGPAAGRPLRAQRRGQVSCAAVPEGGLPGGGPSKPSTRRQATRRGDIGESEQARLESAMLEPAFSAGQERPAGAGGGSTHVGGGPSVALPASPEAEADASWESWQQYFYEMDDVVQELDAVEDELDEAVARENYSAAAGLKKKIDGMVAADCVAQARAALEAAVKEERFQDAARLRDESGVGLLGWWVGRGDGDVHGHLLRVTSDFGRYVGQVYTPGDIAALLATEEPASESPTQIATRSRDLLSSQGSPLGPLGDEADSSAQGGGPVSPDDVGLPVFELFLRPAPEGSEQRYEQQAAALYVPEQALVQVAEEMETESVASVLSEFMNTEQGSGIVADTGNSIVSVERGHKEDGSAFVKIEISSSPNDGQDGPVPGQAGEEEDDNIRTIDDLAASVGVQGDASGQPAAGTASSSSSSKGDVDALEEEQLQRWREQAAAAEGGDAVSRRGIREEVDALTQALLASGGGSGFSAEDPEGSQQRWEGYLGEEQGEDGQSDEAPSAATQLGSMLQRAPAQISWQGRDRFTITVREPPAMARQRQQQEAEAAEAAAAEAQAAAAEAAAAPPPLQRPPVRIIYDGKEQQQQRGQGSGEQQPGVEQQQQQGASSSGGSRLSPDCSVDVEVTVQESDSEDVAVRLTPQGQVPGEEEAPPRRTVAEGPAAAQREQLERLEAERDALKRQREALEREREALQQQLEREQKELAEDSAALAAEIEAIREGLAAGQKPSSEAIQNIAKRAMGLAIAQGVATTDQAGAALAERWAAMEGSTTYERLSLSHQKTDPFSGLYIGSFGMHGPELLLVTRQMEGGKEYAVAKKLTGDPNVPAGTVSWKALLGRGNRMPADVYPPEMAVSSRYRGQGRVAQTGFTNPKWVEGELLVFGPGSSPFVNGAELGFIFDIHHSQRTLILLHRVELDELFDEAQ